MVDTIFWEDNYTANLDPTEKLLFLYFLTNSSTSICGIYQITLKKIAAETGVDKEMIEKILTRFKKDKKMFYENGWLGLRNFIKHQNQNSPKVKTGIENALKDIPETIKALVFDKRKGIDTLSHSNSNSNSNLRESDYKSISFLKKLPKEEIQDIVSRYHFTEKQILSKAEDLVLYCESKGKKYSNYKSFLLNALKKDFGDKVKTPLNNVAMSSEIKL
jgi:hypothetical protein